MSAPVDVDVVVIGGGPAGSTAATLLKKHEPQRRIALYEKATFPRHHVGESTLPDMNPILAKLGVLAKIDAAGFVRKTGITYRWRVDQPMFSEVFAKGVLDALAPSHEAHIPDYSWQIDRSRYDHILLEHARESGVDVHTGVRVLDILQEGTRVVGVRLDGDGKARDVRAHYVVDCSGQARVLSRLLSLERQAHALGDIAIYRYYRGIRWNADLVGSIDSSKIFFSATPSGWMWFIPLSAHDVSVGLVTQSSIAERGPADALFDAELSTVPEMVWMLEGAQPCAAPGAGDATPRTRTVADWSYNHARPCGEGFYLAGDAAAFVDPILSSGILLAHHSGLSVANAILTEWNHPDISVDDLRDGYSTFYADLYRGFLVMASWWYARRKIAGIDEWLATAKELGRSARGAAEIDSSDVDSFMTFAAGYLADFRFVTLGIAFGEEGLATTLDGMENRQNAGSPIRREIVDRTLRYGRGFDRVEVDAYLATDVDSDRWWRLPLLRFHGPLGERIYRPPVAPELRDTGIGSTLGVVERTIRACDGTRSVDDVVRAVCASLRTSEERAVRSLSNFVLADLVMLDLLRPS